MVLPGFPLPVVVRRMEIMARCTNRFVSQGIAHGASQAPFRLGCGRSLLPALHERMSRVDCGCSRDVEVHGVTKAGGTNRQEERLVSVIQGWSQRSLAMRTASSTPW
jgi:hypothetical protein